MLVVAVLFHFKQFNLNFMGRSVSFLTNAVEILYLPFEGQESWEWEDFVYDIKEKLIRCCPSLDEPNTKKWDGREVQIILENELCEIGLSEYCGLASISIRVYNDYRTKESLALHWINQVWPKIKKIFSEISYTKIGNFSNGTSIYEKTQSI